MWWGALDRGDAVDLDEAQPLDQPGQVLSGRRPAQPVPVEEQPLRRPVGKAGQGAGTVTHLSGPWRIPPLAICHEMSCSVMRVAGNVMFCHGPPRLRSHRRPSVSRMPFLHRVSFRFVPFPPPPVRLRRDPVSRVSRARARPSAPARFACLIAHRRARAQAQGARLPSVPLDFFHASARGSSPRLPLHPPALILPQISETPSPPWDFFLKLANELPLPAVGPGRHVLTTETEYR